MTESYSLKEIDWKSVRKTLYLLGGKQHRVTGGHNRLLVKMPSGKAISVGCVSGGKGGKQDYGTALVTGIKQTLQEVRQAKIDPTLFLAVLDNLGGIVWYKVDTTVSQLARYLKESNQQLKTSQLQKECMRGFRVWLVQRKKEETEKILGSEPATEETKVGKGDQEVKWSYTLGDVLSLTDIRAQLGDRRFKNIQSTISGELKAIHEGQHGETADQLRGLLGGNLQITKPGKRLMYRLTETGAWKLAEWLQKKYLPDMALKEIKHEGAADVADVVDVADVADVSPDSASRDDSTGRKARIRGYGQKAIRVCEALGIEVPWDGFALDIEGLLMRLLDRLDRE